MTDVEAKREINRMINEAWCAGEVRCVERDARGEGLRWQGMTVRDPRTVTNRTELIDRYRALESRISEFAEQVLAECVEIDNASLDELLAKAEFRALAVEKVEVAALIDALDERFGGRSVIATERSEQ